MKCLTGNESFDSGFDPGHGREFLTDFLPFQRIVVSTFRILRDQHLGEGLRSPSDHVVLFCLYSTYQRNCNYLFCLLDKFSALLTSSERRSDVDLSRDQIRRMLGRTRDTEPRPRDSKSRIDVDIQLNDVIVDDVVNKHALVTATIRLPYDGRSTAIRLIVRGRYEVTMT